MNVQMNIRANHSYNSHLLLSESLRKIPITEFFQASFAFD